MIKFILLLLSFNLFADDMCGYGYPDYSEEGSDFVCVKQSTYHYDEEEGTIQCKENEYVVSGHKGDFYCYPQELLHDKYGVPLRFNDQLTEDEVEDEEEQD